MPSTGGTPQAWTEDPGDQTVDYKQPSFAPDGNRLVCGHIGNLWILQLQ
jgi:hypothetical protein